AGVSSFGFGGVNAHVVLEEGPIVPIVARQTKSCYLLVLSAKHADSLQQKLTQLSAYLKLQPDLPLEAIAYSLNTTRSHFDHRCALVVASKEELQTTLAEIIQGKHSQSYFLSQEMQAKREEPALTRLLETILEQIGNNSQVLDQQVY